MDLIACEHRHLDFVESALDGDERHYINVCQDCGKIFVAAFKDGVAFNLGFHINVERQVMMINKWPTWILEDDSLEDSTS